MKIECLIERPGGSRVTIDDDIYHFAPDESGAHVSEVEDPDHIGRLLAIPDAYRVARVKAAEPTPAPAPSSAGNGKGRGAKAQQQLETEAPAAETGLFEADPASSEVPDQAEATETP